MAGFYSKCPECDSEDMQNHGGCSTCMKCAWSACTSG